MILVFGKSGQVATELQRQADVLAFGRDQVDLNNPAACEEAIRNCTPKPEAVINAAAYTAVDQAESDEEAAIRLNSVAPAIMAKTCADLDIPFVHISTDYVFDGTGEEPWKPDDTTNPLGVYGHTKLDGEKGVRAAGGNYAILRTSWVFSAHGNNFVKTMLKLGSTRDRLTIVADQIGGPTSAGDIASACLKIVDILKNTPEKTGIYHFSGTPDVSWADFAREIFSQANLTVEVVDIPSSEFPTPAKRPTNSRMDCQTLNVFSIERPEWRESLKHVLSDLGTK